MYIFLMKTANPLVKDLYNQENLLGVMKFMQSTENSEKSVFKLTMEVVLVSVSVISSG
jgi:hypothetical protein